METKLYDSELKIMDVLWKEICLSNMENINAVLIEDGLSQQERLIKLNNIAIHQMTILENQHELKCIK